MYDLEQRLRDNYFAYVAFCRQHGRHFRAFNFNEKCAVETARDAILSVKRHGSEYAEKTLKFCVKYGIKTWEEEFIEDNGEHPLVTPEVLRWCHANLQWAKQQRRLQKFLGEP